MNCLGTLKFIRQNRKQHMDRLAELIAIQSVSTDSGHLEEVKRCSRWLADYLAGMGMEGIQLIPTDLGHPVIYAEHLKAGPDAPVMLVYGHYDVQPPDPLQEWESPPFEASVRGDRLYGRGSSDMKGQLMAVLIALEAAIQSDSFPLNLKFLIEGQEEIGSRNLKGIIEEHGTLFEADFCLNPDAGMWAENRPAITYGLRGLVDFELRIYGPSKDLHSGSFGGTIHNPAQALCELIGGMHDDEGRVTLDGFYDKVRFTDDGEKEKLAELGRKDEYFLDATAVSQLWGEPGYTSFERTATRPTLEVHGLLSGYTGQGTKTIIPSHAMAKISMRIVPNQDPYEIRDLFRAYLEEKIPGTVRWELTSFSQSYPALTNIDSYFVKAMDEALKQIWETPTTYQLGGGSIPVVAFLQHGLGVESVLTGYSLPDDDAHSPNESLHLPTWQKGIESLIYFFEKFNGIGSSKRS